MNAYMFLEKATLQKIHLTDSSSGRESTLMAHFQTSPASFRNSPGFTFPRRDKKSIKKKFISIVGTDKFNEDNISFECSYITARGVIWGLVNPSGEIFSIKSIYWNDYHPVLNGSLAAEIKKEFPKFENDYLGISDKITNEDKINSIVALYILQADDQHNHMLSTIQRYYRSLILKNHLESNLTNQDKAVKGIKI